MSEENITPLAYKLQIKLHFALTICTLFLLTLPGEFVQYLFSLCLLGLPLLGVHKVKGSKMKGTRGNALSCTTFTRSLSINKAKKGVTWGSLPNSRQQLMAKNHMNLNQARLPEHHHHYHPSPVALHSVCKDSLYRFSTLSHPWWDLWCRVGWGCRGEMWC